MEAISILRLYDDCLNRMMYINTFSWSVISPTVKIKPKRPGYSRYKFKASLNVIPEQMGEVDEMYMTVIADTLAEDIEGTIEANKGLLKVTARQIDFNIADEKLFVKYEIEFEC